MGATVGGLAVIALIAIAAVLIRKRRASNGQAGEGPAAVKPRCQTDDVPVVKVSRRYVA